MENQWSAYGRDIVKRTEGMLSSTIRCVYTRCSNNSCALCSASIYYKRATVILYMSLVKLNRLLVRNVVLGKS